MVASLLLVSPVAMPADSVVVLMYHRFGEDKFPSTNIRVEQFESHLEHLEEGGFTVVPLSDVVAAVNEGRELPERAVAITIDDAYRSVYDVALPMFAERNFPFTVFVATDAVDEGLAAYMTWDQMREMSAQGATFANHGAAHDSVLEREAGSSDSAWLERVRSDAEKGARRLAAELDLMPGVFAYPYGEFDSATGDLLQEMGYISFGQHSGAVGPLSDKRALPRYPMAESFGDIGQFRTKAASLPLPVSNVDPWDPMATSNKPSIEITLEKSSARLGELACYVSGQGRVDIAWQEPERRFVVGPTRAFGKGRSRVNCTAPRNDGRYMWFSHQWIIR
jgi:peptidoglycan/xylan/chitin deacetylase (PgdA/CDA1 family)